MAADACRCVLICKYLQMQNIIKQAMEINFLSDKYKSFFPIIIIYIDSVLVGRYPVNNVFSVAMFDY